MSSQLIRQQLVIQNENSNRMMTTEKRNNSKLPLGKAGSGLGNRKALNDITNKPNIHQEASTKKNHVKSPKEEFNIAQERFLHDHSKCIEAQQAMPEKVFWDIVLPGLGPMASEVSVTKIDSCYPEPEELPIPEFPDGLWSVLPQDSPNLSPPCSPQVWNFEQVEFFLKPESNGC